MSRTRIPDSARQELAWQIRELRQATSAPNSSLQEMIELAKRKHYWDFVS
jgi:hypothetical protein